MRSTALRAILVATDSLRETRWACTHGSTRVPQPITPGREANATARFHRGVMWTGTIAENGMRPGTPEMAANGP